MKKGRSQKRLKEIVHYDPATGLFTWKQQLSSRACIGEVAGSLAKGYIHTMIHGQRYKNHRLAWLYMTGIWPKEIDHINRKRNDNRWINLRNVTHRENSRNLPKPITNTSGKVGVYWDKGNNKWRARIRVKDKTLSLGYFSTFDEACKIRKRAEITYGFHKNHGT